MAFLILGFTTFRTIQISLCIYQLIANQNNLSGILQNGTLNL